MSEGRPTTLRPTSWARILPHFLSLATGEAVARLLSVLAWIWLARALGVAALGVLEVTLAIAGYVILAAHGGLDWSGLRSVAQGRPAVEVVNDHLGLRLALAAAGYALLLVLAAALPHPDVRRLLPVYGLVLFPLALSLRWLFLGEERGGTVALATLCGQGVLLAGVLAGIRGPGDLGRVPWFHVAAEATAAGMLIAAFRRRARFAWPGWRARTWRTPLRGALPIGATQILGQLLFNADVILLGALGHLDEVGLYAAAYRIALVLQFLPGVYFTAIFPALAREYDRPGRRTSGPLSSWSLFAVLAISLPASLVTFAEADGITTLVFGREFARAGEVLQILVWTAPVIAARALFRNVLLSTHRESESFRLSLASATANVVLNLMLIPAHGIHGAAAATIASEVALLVLAIRRTRDSLDLGRLAGAAAAPIAAAAAMGLVLAGASGSAPLLRVGLATGTWAIALAGAARVWGARR